LVERKKPLRDYSIKNKTKEKENRIPLPPECGLNQRGYSLVERWSFGGDTLLGCNAEEKERRIKTGTGEWGGTSAKLGVKKPGMFGQSNEEKEREGH